MFKDNDDVLSWFSVSVVHLSLAKMIKLCSIEFHKILNLRVCFVDLGKLNLHMAF